MSASNWYEERKQQLEQESAGKSRQQVAEQLSETAEHVFDPDNAKPIQHNWIRRGIKMSCEGAGHPHHQTWLRHGSSM